MLIKPKEIKIQTQILNKLRKELKPSIWFKIHDIITAGIPDIIGVYKGRFIAIEVKRPGYVPTKLQTQVLKLIQKAGGIAEWADDLSQVCSLIDQWKKW